MRQYSSYYSQNIDKQPSRRPKQRFWKRFFGRKNKIHRTAIQPPKDSWSSNNPWRQQTNRKWHLPTAVIFLFILFSIWIGMMLWLPYFRITNISINGLKIINREEMETFIKNNYLKGGLILPTNNYFLVDSDEIYAGLKKHYLLSDLKIQKIFPKEIKIEAVEKLSTVIYDNGIKCYLLDKEGTAIAEIFVDEPVLIIVTTTIDDITSRETEQATSTAQQVISTTTIEQAYKPDLTRFKTNDLKYLPVIYDIRKPLVEVAQKTVLPPSLISTLMDWQIMIQRQGIGKVRYFELEELTAGIRTYLDRAWYIVFNPQNELETQINNLKVLLRDVKPTEYVNLYYDERIFWK